MSKSQGRNGQEIEGEESEATNGRGVEVGVIEEAGWLRRAAGLEEERAEDRGGIRKISWYRESGLG